jgi:hypothetical protein
MFDDLIIDGFGIERLAELAGRVMLHGMKERSLYIFSMS